MNIKLFFCIHWINYNTDKAEYEDTLIDLINENAELFWLMNQIKIKV